MGHNSHHQKNKGKATGAITAFCASSKCSPKTTYFHRTCGGVYRKRDSLRSVVKDVKIGTSDCPDCGYVLIWERNKNVRV